MKSNTDTFHPWISSIPEGWNYIDLEKACQEIVDNRGKTVPTSDHGIPLIATNCIKNDELYPTFEKIRYVSKNTYENWFRSHPKPGDIIFVNKGSYAGKVCLVPNPVNFCIAQDMVAIRPNKSLVDPEYLFSVLRSTFFQIQLKGFHVGSLIPHIKKSSFKDLIVPLPPKSLQNYIGRIYCDISRKIDILKKQNVVLQKLPETIFKSWFVDFDGQNDLVDSELGEIPRNWKIVKLDDFISVDKGLSYKGKFLSSTGTPLINLGNILPVSGFNDDKMKFYVGDYNQNHLVNNGDIVIANTDITQNRFILGSPAIVPPYLNSNKILFTHHIFAIRNNSHLNNFFLYYLLQTSDYRNRAMGFATGTTVLALPKDTILDFQFILPPEDLLTKFGKISSLVFDLIYKNKRSSKLLSNIVDTLLPKLFTGEIKV